MSRCATPVSESRLTSNMFREAVWSELPPTRVDTTSTRSWTNTAVSGIWRVFRSTEPILPPNYPKLCQKIPYAIECVQTDNGPEFTNRLNSSVTKKPTLFETTLMVLRIRHKLIRPFTPRHNGKVERSHRKDNEELYAFHKFFSFQDFQKQLAVRQRQCNAFPMRPLPGASLIRSYLPSPFCNTSLTNLHKSARPHVTL